MLEVLDAAEADAVVLRSHTAVAWYLDGARTHIALGIEPVLWVIVDRAGDRVVTTVNEKDRLLAEELPPGMRVTALPWYESLATAVPAYALDEAALATGLRRARASLLPSERERYAELGRDCAEVLTDVLGTARPEESERGLAARVTAGLGYRGVDPYVVLVGGASRMLHRHPLPTAVPIGDRAMVVVCGQRYGLVANLTRWVRFTPPSSEERAAQSRIRAVEEAFFQATVPGRTLGAVLAEATAAYAEVGFAADEWLNHHQGGAAGYCGRDPRADPDTDDVVVHDQAFAWNPTAFAIKIEDTFVLASESPRVLTFDPRWPMWDGPRFARPEELVRP
ncbi:M24 family metallopeptidase [Parafrankia sp. FMc6]|uniref:M24 family metallopeptidase n=1 Tax=Parafrankia soli TaxID=2599596 RepID=UPI0034D687D7